MSCLKKIGLSGFLVMAGVSAAVLTASAAGQRHSAPEMTPGPRMIRAVEALANDYLAAEEALSLTPEQTAAVREAVTAFKTDIWRKEAVLLGMFEKISLKRRHGLLKEGDYQATNHLTGGIETDEMGRMIHAFTQLQSILTPKQRAAFQKIRTPKVNLKHPKGFNTRIGLLALRRIADAYGPHRAALGLTAAQTAAIKKLLNAARREVIEIGTQIEISRMEAYDLLKEPSIDPKTVREAMERTARLEGVFFPKLGEYAKRFEAILTPEQTAELKRVRSGARRGRGGDRHGGHPERGGRTPAAHAGDGRSLLERAAGAGLGRTALERLAALEIEAVAPLREMEAEQRIDRMALEEGIRAGAPPAEIARRIDRIAERTAEIDRIRLKKRAAGLALINNARELTFRAHESRRKGGTHR